MKALAIITTFLTLVFVFLWFSAKSDAEKAREDQRVAEDAARLALEQKAAREDELREVSSRTGFFEGEFAAAKRINPADVIAEIEREARLKVPREFWKQTEGAKAEAIDIKKFPLELQQKLNAVGGLIPTPPPAMPDDDSPQEEKDAYAKAKAEYDAKFLEYQKAFEDIFKSGEFKQFKAEIGSAATWALSKENEVLDVTFFDRPTSTTLTLEDVVKLPAPTLQKMRVAFETNMANLISQLQQARQELASREKTISSSDEASLGLREQLAAEQSARVAEVTKLQADVQEAVTKAEQAVVARTNAEQELARIKDESAKEKRTLEQRIAALTEYQRTQKERIDLDVRRNDPDGQILEASVTLGTAYIDLGHVDRVFPGLKFEVYGVGRGGVRERKGTVIVQKALDTHYSQVSVLDMASESRPIVRGDTIHNPFYDPTKQVHVFLAGDLRKYPKSVAAARLRRANVVIDESLGADTDYVVVPDTVRVPVETAAPAEDGEGAAPAAPTQSEYDRWRERARTFGAELITERQLENFLDY